MAVLKADVNLCQGYANCVAAVPEVFDIDDDGIVVLLVRAVAEAERARVEQAVRSCPVSALSIEDG